MTTTMQFINSTPFVPFQFESIDQKLNHFGVTVLRGTFEIENQKPLMLSKDQESLILTDEYFDETTAGSLRIQNSLVPYKPKTDLFVEATSYSPSGRPEASWAAGIQAGTINKQFTVTGPRHWARRFGIPVLSEIEPIDSLEVRYEYAYGGTSPDGRACLENPIGTGFVGDRIARDVNCPQLLPPKIERPRYGEPLAVQGLGPLAPNWAPRIHRCGTYGALWQSTVAPYLPSDFNFEFYNAAPPDLTFPDFAKGNEVFYLLNLSLERELTFGLPDIQLTTLIQFEDGRVIPGPVNLDTIQLQMEDKKAYLEWRGIYPLQIPIRSLEVRLTAPDYMIEF